MPKKPTKKQLEIAERRKKVAENILSGLNYRDIGDALNCSIGTISGDFKSIITRLQHDQSQKASEIVALEIRRLDRALNAVWKKVTDGDLQAIATMIKIMEQRAKYTPLYVPDSHELINRDGDPAEMKDIDAVRQERWNSIAGVLAHALEDEAE